MPRRPRSEAAALASILAGVLFSILNAVAHSWGFAAVVVATIWAGAETTCALIYLASERIPRPVTACALSVRPRPQLSRRAFAGGPSEPGRWDRRAPARRPRGRGGRRRPDDVEAGYVSAAVSSSARSRPASGCSPRSLPRRPSPIRRRRSGGAAEGRARRPRRAGAADDGSEVGLLQAGFNRMADDGAGVGRSRATSARGRRAAYAGRSSWRGTVATTTEVRTDPVPPRIGPLAMEMVLHQVG